MNGMNFGMDGPSVTGWWVNPRTGDKFQAIDTFFEDNNLLVKTSDNKLLNYNQLQNYVQVNDEATAESMSQSIKNKSTKSTQKNEEIPLEILNELENPGEDNPNELLIPDDNIYGTPKAIPTTANATNQPTHKSIKDYDIINRALNGKGSLKLKGDIVWRNFPEKEINMLVDIMNISEDDIIQYYINNISLEEIEDSIKTSVRNYIKTNLHPNDDPTKQTKPKKTTKK